MKLVNMKEHNINYDCPPPCTINADLRYPASARTPDLCRVLTGEMGIERQYFERNLTEDVKRASYIEHMRAGARAEPHSHAGGEEILVLSGTFSDESGTYSEGFYLRCPPGSSHTHLARTDCTLLVKQGQFARFDRKSVRLDTSCANAAWEDGPHGIKTLRLHKSLYEHVALALWPAGLKLDPTRFVGGLELYVLSGRFVDEFGDHKAGDWLRIPAGHEHRPRAIEPTKLYIKTGHLPASTKGLRPEPDGRA
ncbi:MAG TPA: cupin [Hellea balneolensis]|uniref:Cupin n=1 Tax=Hellea balneolensis TaxID=287478 RepID=A0A7V5NXJ7_9PROT|nr:cupin [Hellea balneolensis]